MTQITTDVVSPAPIGVASQAVGVNPADVTSFMAAVDAGLVGAELASCNAVQDNMALRQQTRATLGATN